MDATDVGWLVAGLVVLAGFLAAGCALIFAAREAGR